VPSLHAPHPRTEPALLTLAEPEKSPSLAEGMTAPDDIRRQSHCRVWGPSGAGKQGKRPDGVSGPTAAPEAGHVV